MQHSDYNTVISNPQYQNKKTERSSLSGMFKRSACHYLFRACRKRLYIAVYSKFSIYLLYFKNQGLVLPLFFPAIIRFQKTAVDQFLRRQTCLYCFVETAEQPHVKTLFLKTDGYPVSPVLSPGQSPEPAGIIFSVFSLFQPFHTGIVYPGQLCGYLLLNLLFQTSAAAVIAVEQPVHTDVNLRPAAAPAMPYYRTFPIPLICGIQGSQPPELLACDITHSLFPLMLQTSTAFYLTGLQIMGRDCMEVSAVTLTLPAGTVFPVRHPVQHSQISKSAPGQVFRNGTVTGILFRHTSAVGHGTSGQSPGIDENFSSAVTPAAPHSVMISFLLSQLRHRQHTEPTSQKIFWFTIAGSLPPLFLFRLSHTSSPLCHFARLHRTVTLLCPP